MPPKLALIICTFIVLWLLRLDHKQTPEVSFASWIPAIWLLQIACKPLALWLGAPADDMLSGSPLDRNFLIILFFLGLFVLVKRKFTLSSIIRGNLWLILLIVYMFISILWSDLPFTSFKRWTRELIAVVMSFLIATECYPFRAIQSILRRVIYIIIPFSYILIHYFSEYGREYNKWTGELMWIGVATQKNGLALLCLFAAFFLTWSYLRRRKGADTPAAWYQSYLEAFILILTFWLMGGPQHSFSYSATSNTTLFIGLFTFIVFSWMKKHNILVSQTTLMFIVALVIGYGTITPFIGKLSLIDISYVFGRDETLTGRSIIWERLMPYVMDRPIWGHGYGGFWTDEIRQQTESHAHNGYLDIILNIGFFGLFLFTMFFLSCCRKAQKEMSNNFDIGILFICYLLMTVVHNIAESSTVGLSGKLMAVVLVLSVSSAKTPSENQDKSNT